MVRGLIQYTWSDRLESKRRKAYENAFRTYIRGFARHAFDITGVCPECNVKAIKASKIGFNKEASEYLDGLTVLSITNTEACHVIGVWKCNSCGHVHTSNVDFKGLLEDFRNPELRQKVTA
jgi:hypothetical protein